MKLNNFGFTLIEMLATITILGILTVIAMPIISGIQYGFTERKIEAYKESAITAAKLYIDAYSEDVFGYRAGLSDKKCCVQISFEKLLDKKLLEAADLKNMTGVKEFFYNRSFVNVTKSKGQYSYEAYLLYNLNGKEKGTSGVGACRCEEENHLLPR